MNSTILTAPIREVPVWQKNRPGKEAGAAVMQKMAV